MVCMASSAPEAIESWFGYETILIDSIEVNQRVMCLEMTLSLVLGPLLSAVKQGCVGSIDSILEGELACGGEGPVECSAKGIGCS